MLLSRDQACNSPSSTTPIPASVVASSQSLAAAFQDAVNRAQAAVNSILTRQPSDFSSFGPVVQVDVAVSNAQNQAPGVVPFGAAIPSAFPSGLSGIPQVQPRRGGAANRGAWGGGRFSIPGVAARVTGNTWPDGSPVNAGARSGPASRPVIANPDGIRPRRQNFQMTAGLQPATGGPPSGFLGRGEPYSTGDSAPVDTSPVFASPNPPAPQMTINSAGLSGAYPVSSDSCAAAAAVGGAGAADAAAAADTGISPVWWLVIAGVVVWAMAASDEPAKTKAKKQYTRRAA